MKQWAWKKERNVALWLVLMLVFSFVTPVRAEVEAGAELNSVIVEDVYIPMRDGVELSAKVYRPSQSGEYPILLSRTPYGSGAFMGTGGYRDYEEVGNSYAQDGYVVVVQDVRGKGASGGNYLVYENDAQDGYDTVEWVSHQTWSDGKVGTFGDSARGFTQLLLAPDAPSALKAMFVVNAPSDYYRQSVFQGGAFRLDFLSWIVSLSPGGGVTDYTYTPLNKYPNMEQNTYFQRIVQHPMDDGAWDFVNIEKKYNEINVPSYFVGGWFDIYADGGPTNFVGLQENGGPGAKGNQKLLMGPWMHNTQGDNLEIEGDEVAIYEGEMKRWFEYWLKGIDNGIMDEQPVKYFEMGNNQWRTAADWPVETQETNWYLDGGINGSADSINDGRLSVQMAVYNGSDSFTADPNKAVPTLGGQNFSLPAGPADERSIEKDALTYTSDVFTEDMQITGSVSANLYVSSDAKDTDFSVMLTDVAPDGTSSLIMDRIQRARYREGQDKEVFMEKGEVYNIPVQLGNISQTIKEGHRLRVIITGSNFQKYDRNPNTGNPFASDTQADFVIANNVIYHTEKYPSSITLPIESHVYLNGPETATTGENFNVTFGVQTVQSSVYQEANTMGLNVSYDPQKLEFVDVSITKEGYQLSRQVDERVGQVKLFASSSQSNAKTNGDWVKLSFRGITDTATTTITVNNTELSTINGDKLRLGSVSKQIALLEGTSSGRGNGVAAISVTDNSSSNKIFSMSSTDTSLIFPGPLSDYAQGEPVVIQYKGLKLQIPSSVFDALLKASAEGTRNGTFLFEVHPIDAAGLLTARNVNLKLEGEIYDFSLYLQTEEGEKIELDSFADPVTVSLPYASGNEEITGVFNLNDKNQNWEYIGGKLNPSDRTITADLRHFSKYAVLEYDKVYSDVTEQHWAYQTIRTLSAKQIAQGTSDSLFNPEGRTTRAEFTAFLVRALQLSTDRVELPFTDVNQNAWYYDSVEAAYKTGLIQGGTDGRFAPNDLITREQIATLIVRAAEWKTQDAIEYEDALEAYMDGDQVSDWAAVNVNKALATGLMSGRGENVFDPASFINRAESAQAVLNLLNGYE